MMSYVVKRDGRRETCKFDKITARIIRLSYGLSQEYVDCVQIAQKVVQGVYPGVTTSQLDELAAETAAYLSTNHPDYGVLAARIAVSNLQKNTKKSFSETVKIMYEHTDPKTGDRRQLISDEIYKIVTENAEILDSAIIYDRDFNYDYFGFKTLERSYLLRVNGKVVERPQHMLMRVSVGIHHTDISAAIETYNYMSEKFFTHASPTLFNSGTPRPQLSSCFLINMESDSIEGIYNTLKKCAVISKSAGGIGLSTHCIRSKGSYIKGTNGYSNGLVPMLRVFNDTARYVDQGGGKRKGAIAIYLEPWHADVFEFLELKKNHGIEEQRARDLFFALWVPDLFMKRVEANGVWSLFCPCEAPGLDDCWGEAFENKYEEYEKKQLFKKQVKAQDLWFAILESQIQTGTPYLLYKDACNSKSNQKNLGTIKSSNLCTEIVQYSSPDEIAVCNLASISLPKCVEGGSFSFQKLAEVTRVVTKNLNKIIDINHYPVEEAKRSNFRHRPIGIGIQGLADVFLKLRYPFESDQARVLNRDIFETIYYAALDASCTLAERDGAYETYEGSPVSQGVLQFDMWDQKPNASLNLDWAGLRGRIRQFGVRNSLLVAPMPTASTSQILGNNEAFEPYTSNLYTRRVLAGEFTVVNHHLLKDLTERGIWNERVKQGIIADNGSIQNIQDIPSELKELYKTVWEIKQRTLIDMAADRGAFIDQSQSFNVFVGEPSFGKLTSMHFYSWKKGLKTGMYYLRTKPACDAIKFTLDSSMLADSVRRKNSPNTGNDNLREAQRQEQIESMVCSLVNKDACISCGS